MPSNTRMHYKTKYGGPPNGGIPPGRTRALAIAAFSGPPPPYIPPPAYTAYPVHIVEITPPAPPSPAPPPYGGYLPWAPFPTYPVPVIQVPVGFYPPPSPPPPPSQPPARPQPTEPPGAKMDGAKIEFDDGISTYIFPEDHAIIHFVNFEHQPVDHPGEEFGFTVHKVPCFMPIKELIRRLGCPGTHDTERGIVECLETGDGTWMKGSTFRLHEDRSKQRLEDIGWTKSRGTDRKPVWLAVYKG
ncbi:Dishevelled associated activator of morphogenesis 2 [Xylographa vitiligo]|nr:Dishevelled associated activator of morphogenesis 2 [Xylographa vitiligo]